MRAYLASRLVQLTATLLAISTIVFAIIKSEQDRPPCELAVFANPASCAATLPPRGRNLETR